MPIINVVFLRDFNGEVVIPKFTQTSPGAVQNGPKQKFIPRCSQSNFESHWWALLFRAEKWWNQTILVILVFIHINSEAATLQQRSPRLPDSCVHCPPHQPGVRCPKVSSERAPKKTERSYEHGKQTKKTKKSGFGLASWLQLVHSNFSQHECSETNQSGEGWPRLQAQHNTTYVLCCWPSSRTHPNYSANLGFTLPSTMYHLYTVYVLLKSSPWREKHQFHAPLCHGVVVHEPVSPAIVYQCLKRWPQAKQVRVAARHLAAPGWKPAGSTKPCLGKTVVSYSLAHGFTHRLANKVSSCPRSQRKWVAPVASVIQQLCLGRR